MIPHGRFVLKIKRLIITPLQTYLALPFRIILGYIACFRTIPFGGFLKYGYPKSSKSLDHFSIETYGFGDPPILRNPCFFSNMVNHSSRCWLIWMWIIFWAYSQFMANVYNQNQDEPADPPAFFLHFFSNKGHFGVHLHRPACVVG